MNIVPVNGNNSQSIVISEEDVNSILAFANSIRDEGYKRMFDYCVSLRMFDLPGKVAVVKGQDNSATILVDADDEFIKDIAISCDNGRLSIRGPSASTNFSFSGNGIHINANNITIGNMRFMGAGRKWEKEPKIIIMVPTGIGIISKNINDSFVAGINGDVNIDVSGESKTKIIGAKDLKIDCSGTTDINARDVVGNVNIDSAGQSVINITGEMEDFEIDASGMCDTNIFGVIRKDLVIDASGMTSINCHAKVLGEIEKDFSGMCNLNFF